MISTFGPLHSSFAGETITLTDSGFVQANAAPSNIKICQRGEWNERMLIERIFSVFTVLFYTKKMRQRTERHIKGHLACLTAALNLLLILTEGALAFTDFTL